MTARFLLRVLLLTASVEVSAQDGWVEGLQERLTVSNESGSLRARLSGTLELEAYALQQPPPGLLYTDDAFLLNPRLSLYVDAQAGPAVYGFLQVRVDRGFDPVEAPMELRLDEYAVRVTPWADGRFTLQVGRFGTVVGNWVRRHGAWDNPFITAPAAYETLTAIWDGEAALTTETLLRWGHVRPNPFATEYEDKHLRVPMIWGPSYATGVAVSGRLGKVDYAAEMKNASLSSRPEYWSPGEVGWRNPTYSGRLGYRPDAAWDLGVSASTGTYLVPEARWSTAGGHGLSDYRQTLVAADLAYAWRHLQVWAEVFRSRFTVPAVGNPEVSGYYVEVKYKMTPRLFGSVRWNQQWYGTLYHPAEGRDLRWGRNLWRIDLAPTYRFSTQTQLKVQFSLLHESDRAKSLSTLWAVQMTTRF